MKLAIVLLFAASAFGAEIQSGQKIQIRTGDAKNTNHSAVLTWTLATTCQDGTPCTPVLSTVYKVVGTCSAPTSQFTKISTVPYPTRTYTDANLAAATSYCYYVTASLAAPPTWDATVTYTGGQQVSYQGAVYVALNNASANLNQPPNTATTFWMTSTVESTPSNTFGGSTGTTGPPAPPQGLTITLS